MLQLFRWFQCNKTRTTWVASIWTVLIFVGCFLPGKDVPDVQLPLIDKWVHLILFGGFSFFWLACLKKTIWWHYLLVLFISVCLGYFVELIQGSGLVQGRSKDMMDVLADGIGGMLGVLIFVLLKKSNKKFVT